MTKIVSHNVKAKKKKGKNFWKAHYLLESFVDTVGIILRK